MGMAQHTIRGVERPLVLIAKLRPIVDVVCNEGNGAGKKVRVPNEKAP